MNLKQFKYVLTLADKGSFSQAAEALNVSQPSLSQYIRRIEHDLDITLFDRSGGDVKLTDAGRVYLQAGKKILDTERQMQSQFSDLRAYKTGTLTVGIAPTRCQYLMPQVVKSFSALYPGMHLIIEERFLSKLIEGAEHGEFDLCVATLPVDEKKFVYELMMQEEIVLAVPHELPLCRKLREMQYSDERYLYPVIDIRNIDSAAYVALSDTQPTQVLLREFCEKFDLSLPVAVQCMSIETQFSMVKAGIGCALIPSSLAKYGEAANVDYFSLAQTIPQREMAVIYRRGQYLSEAAIALKKIMTSI